MTPRIDLRRADSRYLLQEPGIRSEHSFSFGPRYDPANTRFGFLVCHHVAHLDAGAGFATHPHANLEIVSWVLDGAVRHVDDSTGTPSTDVINPGTAQLLSAGSGVRHSEHADDTPTRLLQMWVTPDDLDLTPRRARAEVDPAADWVSLAGGDGLLPLRCRGAELWRGSTTTHSQLPEADLLHVFVASGHAVLEDGTALQAGDAVRALDAGGITLDGEAELLVWAMRRP